jgi:hypothetical protein
MITRNALGAIALATTCLAPLAAFADDFTLEPAPAATDTSAAAVSGTQTHGDIGFGLMGVGGKNPDQAGRYTGLNTTGINGIGQFDVNGRASWNSGGTRFFDFTGNNLVFQTGNNLGSTSSIGSGGGWGSGTRNSLMNSGSLGFDVGDQGTWRFGVYYDAITYTGNVIDSLYTVNGGRAVLNNNLAPWGGATSATTSSAGLFTKTLATIPALQATGAMQPFQMGTRRDIIGGDGKYVYDDWTFSAAVRHEHKEGSMEESFDGPWGGTAFGLPINYDTDRYDVSAAYTTRHFQASLQYTFSHFVDNNLFVNLPYPTSNTAKPFQESAAYSMPPSTDAHYLTLMLASNDIVPKTRLNLNARVGVELQNNTFAPNTADPNPAGATLTGLNSAMQGTSANSPDMMATVYQLKLSAASHPLTDVNTRLYYGLDGRSVSLNQSQVYVGGTGGSAADATPGGSPLTVVPQDWLKQNAGAEVGYRIIPEYDTKVTVGYRLDTVDRSNAQVGHSWTNTGSVALTSEIGPQVDGKLSFEYADRSGAINYLGPWSYIGQAATYSGAYYQAPMTSEAVTLRADYTPMPSLNGGLFFQFKNENYNYPAATLANNGGVASTLPLTGVGQGIKQDYALSVGPDVNYRPSKDVNLHFFYTYELLFYNNTGNGACSTAATAITAACAGTAGYFQNQQTSSTHTIGVAGDWRVNEKLKLRGEYTFSYGSVMFAQYNGVFVTNPTASNQNLSNYPDINSTMNNVKLTATYEVMPDLDLVFQGTYTMLTNNDWNDTANAIQGAGTTAVSILTPGYSSPYYSIATVMAGIKFRF